MGKLEGLMIAINQRIDTFQRDVALVRDELNKKDACWHASFDTIRASKEGEHKVIDERLDALDKKVEKILTVVSTIVVLGGGIWTLISFVADHFLK